MTENGIGKLYIVGVGPGDPELITLKARRVLSQVDVIFAPQKSSEHASFARSILNGMGEYPDRTAIDLVFPMKPGAQTAYWEHAAETIWEHLSKGKDCAFINEGDPTLYGTSAYVLPIFHDRYPEVEIEVIPGISSITAAAARAQVPLASAGERIAILPAIYEDGHLQETLKAFDTVILMKVHRKLVTIQNVLREMNVNGSSVYVRRCTTSEEEIVRDMTRLGEQEPDYFSLMIVRRQNGG